MNAAQTVPEQGERGRPAKRMRAIAALVIIAGLAWAVWAHASPPSVTLPDGTILTIEAVT